MPVCPLTDLTDEQRGVLGCITGTEAPSCIIEAVAGCGKTTVLLHYLRHAIDGAKDRVLFVAFNRTTAQWARECVGESKNLVNIQTFHAFAHSMFPQRQLDPDATFSAFSDMTRDRKFEEDTSRKRSLGGDAMPSEKQLWTATRRTIDRIRCSGMRPDVALTHYLPEAQTEHDRDTLRLAARVLDHIVANPEHSIELDDTVYLAAVDSKLKLPCYQGIVVDEIQDANPAQLILLSRLLEQSGPTCRFLAVGDPKQSIYSFRYAHDAIEGLRTRLGRLHRPVTMLSLSVCFRCPRAVVHLARSIQPSIQTAQGARLGTVAIRGHVTSNLLSVLQRRAASTNRPILCIQRFNRPILHLLWDVYQRGAADASTTRIRWLSPSMLTDLREHLAAMLGLGASDGDIADVLRTGLVDDATIRSQWRQYKSTRSAHVWDMSPVVRLAIERSLCAEWYTFLLDHISAALPSLDAVTVVLSTIHCTKGLTFPGVVAIVDYNAFSSGGDPEASHLLYVALTRTTEGLLFLFTKDPYQSTSPYFQVDDIEQTDGFCHLRDDPP